MTETEQNFKIKCKGCTLPRYPTREKYSCIDFWDPKSGILGLFGFLLPNFSTKMVFFYAFWRAAVKNQNKTIQLDFCQIRSYLAVLGTVRCSWLCHVRVPYTTSTSLNYISMKRIFFHLTRFFSRMMYGILQFTFC